MGARLSLGNSARQGRSDDEDLFAPRAMTRHLLTARPKRVARPDAMLYCYIMIHHHHRADDVHPSPTITPSLLRISVPQRLGIAGALAALIWLAALWALR